MLNTVDPDTSLVAEDIELASILKDETVMQNFINNIIQKMLDTYLGEPIDQETITSMTNFLKHYLPLEFTALTGKEVQIPVTIQPTPDYNGLIILCQINKEKFCTQFTWR